MSRKKVDWASAMDYLLPFINPAFYTGYVPLITCAVLLFLVSYITALITQAKKLKIVQPVSLPFWLNIMYPSWLDKLTLRKIVKSFAWSLGIAIISWIVLAIIFLAILARGYGSWIQILNPCCKFGLFSFFFPWGASSLWALHSLLGCYLRIGSIFVPET